MPKVTRLPTRSVMLSDLKQSGLERRDVTTLNISFCNPSQTAKLLNSKNYRYYSYKIPYFDIHGKQTEFFRIRFLEDVYMENAVTAAQGFKKDKKEGKQPKTIRYSQLAKTGCHLYLAPLIDWKKIVNDTSIPIIITEGEKKAACACKNNIPTIGLGGVYSFLSEHENLLPDFQYIDWRHRKVIICYDNDLASNEQVLEAEQRLAAYMLLDAGAKVHIKRIPYDGKHKMGIDDYILGKGMMHFKKLREKETNDSKTMHGINHVAAYVNDLNCVITLSNKILVGKGKEAMALANHSNVSSRIMNQYDKPVNPVNTWMKWVGRAEIDSLCYEPDQQPILQIGKYKKLNMWRGWGVQPSSGNIKPFQQLVDHVFKRANREEKAYFYQWLAYPIQNPGIKIKVGVLVYGMEQGTGKSFIGVTIGDIYGANYIKITQSALDTSFNSWAVNKQFVMGEEISGVDKRKHNNEVKDMLTRETITVNRKYEPEYQIQDCANYYFTSNHPDAVFLEDSDRRFFVIETSSDPLPQSIVKDMNIWRSGGGVGHLMYYLQNKISCKGFNQHGPAPMTKFKQDMMHISKSDIERFCQDLHEIPEDVLIRNGEFIGKSWFDIDELMWFYDPMGNKKVTKTAFAKALRRIGFNAEIKTVGGKSRRLYCIVGRDKTWRQGTAARNYVSVMVIPDRKARLTVVGEQ